MRDKNGRGLCGIRTLAKSGALLLDDTFPVSHLVLFVQTVLKARHSGRFWGRMSCFGEWQEQCKLWKEIYLS